MPARVQLAPETIAALLGGIVDGRTTSDLAAALGLNWYTANWWARRERTGVPWAEPVAPYSCTVCGEAGIGTPRRAIHPACETAWRNAYASGRRRAGIAKPSTPYVETYREEHPDGRARDRLAERERVRRRGREPDIARAHEYDRAASERLAELATTRGPFDDDEIEALLARARDRAEDIAADLGRSLWSVRHARARALRERPRLAAIVRGALADRSAGHWLWPDAVAREPIAAEAFALTYPGRGFPGPCPTNAACIRPSHAVR